MHLQVLITKNITPYIWVRCWFSGSCWSLTVGGSVTVKKKKKPHQELRVQNFQSRLEKKPVSDDRIQRGNRWKHMSMLLLLPRGVGNINNRKCRKQKKINTEAANEWENNEWRMSLYLDIKRCVHNWSNDRHTLFRTFENSLWARIIIKKRGSSGCHPVKGGSKEEEEENIVYRTEWENTQEKIHTKLTAHLPTKGLH